MIGIAKQSEPPKLFLWYEFIDDLYSRFVENEHHMKLRHERDVERTKRTKDREIERLQAQMELQKEELQAKLMKSESTSGRMRKKLEDLEDEMDNLRHTVRICFYAIYAKYVWRQSYVKSKVRAYR